MRTLGSLASLTAMAVLPLTAQDTTRVQKVGEITVTAERFPQSVATTPAIVRVISARQLANRAAPDLPTLLRDIPGVQLDPVVGSGASISMQGLGSDRILFLLDGAPVEGRLANQMDLTRLDPSLFQRIEIVEGPQSTLYGSSALGGVVNLITRTPGNRRAEFTTEGGSFGQLDLSGHLGVTAGATTVGFDGSRRHVDVPPGQATGVAGSSDRWDVMGRLIQPLGPSVLNLRTMFTHESQVYAAGAPGSPTENTNRNNQVDLLGTVDVGAAQATQIRAHVSTYDHALAKADLTSGTVQNDPQTQRLADLEVIHRGAIGSNEWVTGARVEHEWITSARLASGSQSTTTGSAYTTLQWHLSGAVSVATGARLTVAERWGTDLAPRVGLVWSAAGGWYAKAGVAHGFRAPAFTEQFSDFVDPSGYFILQGNASLKPESSWNATAEVGVDRAGGSLYLRGYGNRLRNFIEASMVGVNGQLPIFTYENVGKARTRGVEVGGNLRHGAVVLDGSYAFLDAKDEVSNAPLLGRARHTVRAGLGLDRARWSLRSEVVRVSRFPLSQDPQTNEIIYQGASPRVNLRGTLAVSKLWSLRAGVDNVGDQIPVNAFAGYGRRWFAGMTWGVNR